MRRRKILIAYIITAIIAVNLVGCGYRRSVQETTIPLYVSEQTEGEASDMQETEEISDEATTDETTTDESVSDEPESVKPRVPDDDEFVKISDYIPNIVVDLRYATHNNFTGQQIYQFTEPWLRYGTVKKLIQVQETLEKKGLYLKVWDAFRPTTAQFKLWEICPDPTYVSNPNNGFSSHSRGNTVDITLVYEDGTELVMPTGFDDFSELANRDYSDCSNEAASNAKLLEEVMRECGFSAYYGEWWHFSDTTKYEVEKYFIPTE